MKQAFIPQTATLTKAQQEMIECANNLDEAKELAPWACEVIEVDGGFMAFESASDLTVWENQQ